GLFRTEGVGVVAVGEVDRAAQRGDHKLAAFRSNLGDAVMAHGATLSLLGIAYFTVQRKREGPDTVVLGSAAMAAFAAKFGVKRTCVLSDNCFTGQRIG